MKVYDVDGHQDSHDLRQFLMEYNISVLWCVVIRIILHFDILSIIFPGNRLPTQVSQSVKVFL